MVISIIRLLCGWTLAMVGWVASSYAQEFVFEKRHGLVEMVDVILGEQESWTKSHAGRRFMAPILPLEVTSRFSPAYTLVFGDTDHDGIIEVIYCMNDLDNITYRIAERQPDDSYVIEYVSPECGSQCSAEVFASGDLDGDGKSELVAQSSFSLRVYEALDSKSHPTEITWQSQPISNVIGYPKIGDSDRDGNMEIYFLLNSSPTTAGLFIFENTGDDAFEQKYFYQIGNGFMREMIIADLDGDGLPEIAIPGTGGDLYIFESPQDDLWEVSFVGPTTFDSTDGIAGPLDTDGDGSNEFLVYGNELILGNVVRRTLVYEALGNDVFGVIDVVDHQSQTSGISHTALSDTNGDGVYEYLARGNGLFWVHEPAGDGTWNYIGEFQDPYCCLHGKLRPFDLNENGRDEIFWLAGSDSTLILESPVTSSVGNFIGPRNLGISPNPFRLSTKLYLPEYQAQRLQLSVYDVAGRRVSRRDLAPSPSWTWEAKGLPAGVYLIRIERPGGESVATTRATILR